MTAGNGILRAPKHLRPATRRWWEGIARDYDLAPHHVKLLVAAGEAWDRYQQAREALAVNGTTFTDRFGMPHSRPEVAIERDSRLAFVRTLRELNMSENPPDDSRPPKLKYGG